MTAPTGLARIARELATRIHKYLGDVFRVGTYGYGAHGSRHLGFPQYAMSEAPESTGFVLPDLEYVWEDFAGPERGVLLSIWDLSRLMWLGIPERAPQLMQYPSLRQFLLKKPFARWAYLPIDADGPNGRLTFPLRMTLPGFDRILAYSKWAENIIHASLSVEKDVDNLPHGIDTDVFFPTKKELCRKQFLSITGSSSPKGVQRGITPDEKLIGIVATNQHRKDWALGIETVALLSKQNKVRIWLHSDAVERYWSYYSLLDDFGLIDRSLLSMGHIPDDKMAMAYSACDLTLGIGSEGFGYPIAESLACGTPVVHMTYAGGSEVAPKWMQVEPVAYRYEGMYACKRPIHDPKMWAQKAAELWSTPGEFPDHLDWKNLWPRWEQWLRKGVNAEKKS